MIAPPLASDDPPYAGQLSRTRTGKVHFACPGGMQRAADVFLGVNAATDPELAARLREGTLNQVSCPGHDMLLPVDVPVLYHDERHRRLVLVLPLSYRHRELEERARVLLELAADREHDVPAYARDFEVAYGADGLVEILGTRRRASTGRPGGRRPPSNTDAVVIADAGEGPDTSPMLMSPSASSEDTQVTRLPRDVAVEQWIASGDPTHCLLDGHVLRFLATVTPERFEPFLVGELRAELSAMPTSGSPAMTVSVVPPDESATPLRFDLDLKLTADRGFLAGLASGMRCRLDLYDARYLPMVQRPVEAPPRASMGWALGAGDDWDADEESQPSRVVSGIIGAGVAPRAEPRKPPPDSEEQELLVKLQDRAARRDAAIELCQRGDLRSLDAVFDALEAMTRGEAVRVFPAMKRLGTEAVPRLVRGLHSRKGFVRQGCALTLGILKAEGGIDPLCRLLLEEPTDVWKEVARALGELGGGAVMSLALVLRDSLTRGEASPLELETRARRVSWALAHIVARGNRGPVEALAGGREPVVAQCARDALEMVGAAETDDAQVKGKGGETTVNRAFSRKFFEAMRGEYTGVDDEPVLLQESDLVEEVEREL